MERRPVRSDPDWPLFPSPPVPGFLAQVRDRDNKQIAVISAVDESEREAPQWKCSMTTVERFAYSRCPAKQRSHAVGFIQNFEAQARDQSLTTRHGRRELLLRGSVEPDLHLARRALIRANTSSAGTVCTVPASISSERRCTSSRQAASTSASAGPSSSSSSTRSSASLSELLSERSSSSSVASERAMTGRYQWVSLSGNQRNQWVRRDFMLCRPSRAILAGAVPREATRGDWSSAGRSGRRLARRHGTGGCVPAVRVFRNACYGVSRSDRSIATSGNFTGWMIPSLFVTCSSW